MVYLKPKSVISGQIASNSSINELTEKGMERSSHGPITDTRPASA
jgi:hypothetical protein